MSKLIVIAGIKRSGSTWMYNAVRLILKHAGYSVAGGGEQHFDPNCEADYQIVKVHPFRPELARAADYVFISDRDYDEIRVSWKGFSGEVLTDVKLKSWIKWLCQWREYSCYEMWYFDMAIDPMECLSTIHRKLFGDPVDILTELEAIRPPTDADYDPETLLFKNHITSA